MLDQGTGLQADVVGGADAGSEDGGFAGLDNVAHLAVNEAADDEVAPGLVGKAGVFGVDGAGGLGKKFDFAAEFLFGKEAGFEAVIEVVAAIGRVRRQGWRPGLRGRGSWREALWRGAGLIVWGLVFGQALAGFPGEVQAAEAGVFFLQFLDDAQALTVVLEAAVAAHQLVQHLLAFVAERGMAQIVRQGDGFGQVVVQVERAGDAAGDGGDFDGVGQARAQMVAGAVEEDLGLVFQAAKGARVDDAVAVALVFGAPQRGRFRMNPAARIGAELGVRGQSLAFPFFELFSGTRHVGRAVGSVASSSWTEKPRSSNRRRMASSMRLFGQEAPAVMPTVILPGGSQSRVSISCWRCRSKWRINLSETIMAAFLTKKVGSLASPISARCEVLEEL